MSSRLRRANRKVALLIAAMDRSVRTRAKGDWPRYNASTIMLLVHVEKIMQLRLNERALKVVKQYERPQKKE